jgi:hypothetical protein
MHQKISLARTAHHLLAQVTRDLFGRFVPESYSAIQSHHIHADRKRLHDLAKEIGIERRHSFPIKFLRLCTKNLDARPQTTLDSEVFYREE